MTTYRIDIEANELPYVCVDVESDEEPTPDQIEAAVNDLASAISFEGYMAEHASKVGYTVTNIERY